MWGRNWLETLWLDVRYTLRMMRRSPGFTAVAGWHAASTRSGFEWRWAATRNDVIRMVLGDALGMVCVGLAIGAPIAYWGKSFAASLIQDLPVNSAAPIVFGAVAMTAVALLAAYVSARRAANVDPIEALRHE